MKNKIQKMVGFFTIVIMISSNGHTRESYAGRGALIGGVAGGAVAGTFGGVWASLCESGPDTCDVTAGSVIGVAVIAGFVGAGVGAGLGALIGYAIPKNPKISVVPVFTQSKTNGTTAGGSLQVRF